MDRERLSLAERCQALSERSLSSAERTKIAKLEWFLYDRRRDESRPAPLPAIVLRVTADNGAQGVCQLPAWHRESCGVEHQEQIEPLVLGREPLHREAIWESLYAAHVPLALLSFVDVALWDLYGRMQDQPVHALLGTQRDNVNAYRSTGFNVGPPEAYAEYAVECKARGYQGYKIHPYRVWDGESDAEKDIPVYRAVREAVGPDFPLMSDNYYSYNYEEALRVGRVLDELDYTWYESPMPENDDWIERYVELRRQVRTPICAPETAPGAHDTRIRWIEVGATDMGRLDVFYGGLTSCFKTAIACEQAGIPMDLHCALFPHFQVFGATSESLIPCVEDYGEPLWHEMDTEGRVPIPGAPGVGFGLDWDHIEANQMEWSELEKR